jgi:hypothetical protein
MLICRYPWLAAACTAAVAGLAFFFVPGHGVAFAATMAVVFFFWWGACYSLILPAGEWPSWVPAWRRWAFRRPWWFVGLVGVAAGAVNAGVRLALTQSLVQALVMGAFTLVVVPGGTVVMSRALR